MEGLSVNIVADERKLAELILYVAARLVDDPKGGATKINKVLFAAEFAHTRLHGAPITGVTYQKLKHGPAPRRLVPIRDELVRNGSAERRRDYYLGYPLDRLVPLRDADTTLFTDDEIKIVDQAITALWSKTAVEASELSHRELGWRMVDMGEDIPYEAAYLAPSAEATEAIIRHAQTLAGRLGR